MTVMMAEALPRSITRDEIGAKRRNIGVAEPEQAMSRIQLVAVEAMTPKQRVQYNRFPSNLTRGLLVLDQPLAEALPGLANALRASSLDARTREGVIVRVASLCDSAYEQMQHSEQVLKAGWTKEQVEAIKQGRLSDLPDRDATILRFVDACVATQRVPDDAFDAIRELVSDKDLATIILLVGHYMMVARFTATLGIELDAMPDNWSAPH